MIAPDWIATGALVSTIACAVVCARQRRRADRSFASADRARATAEALHETMASRFTRLQGSVTPMDPGIAPRAFTAADRALAVVHTGRIYPPGHYAEIRSSGVVTAKDRIADALNIMHGSDVAFRARVAYTETHEPVSCSTSWFHAACLDRCPDLLQVRRRIVGGTAAYVAVNTGRHGPVSGVDRVAASTANEQEAALLHIPTGSAVLRIHCTWVAADGTALEFGESVQPAERWGAYRYDLPGAL